MNRPLRVGIVGANAHRAWAHDAHVPALKRLPQFELSAVSARSQDLAEEARAAWDVPRAFGDSLALARDPDIDVVAVTVKVPEHRAVVLAALAAGKHVYCEWPLGCDVAEATEMAAAVGPSSHVIIGLQGLSAPAIRHAATAVQQGVIGQPRVLRVISPTAGWGAEAPAAYAYLQDKRNGATLETIAGGHTLAAMEAIVGSYREVDARNSTLRRTVRIQGSGTEVERTCADHMAVLGLHAGGCVSTLEVIGGSSAPFVFELTGDTGWLKISGGLAGGYQVGRLTVECSAPTSTPTEPAVEGLRGAPGNVAEAYVRLAADIASGQRTVPDFDDAVRLSRLLDRIDIASATGRRQDLET